MLVNWKSDGSCQESTFSLAFSPNINLTKYQVHQNSFYIKNFYVYPQKTICVVFYAMIVFVIVFFIVILVLFIIFVVVFAVVVFVIIVFLVIIIIIIIRQDVQILQHAASNKEKNHRKKMHSQNFATLVLQDSTKCPNVTPHCFKIQGRDDTHTDIATYWINQLRDRMKEKLSSSFPFSFIQTF